MNDFLTVSDLAKVLSVPIHRVRYVIDTRNLKPTFRIGNLRAFPSSIVPILKGELESKQPQAISIHLPPEISA